MRKNEQGVALILALFLVVALEVLILGSMMTAMRSQRMSQRSLDRTKNLWVIEAVLDRTNQLFAAYFEAESKFPNTDANSFVLGNDSQVTGNQTFSDYLAAWYAELKARHSDALNTIQIPATNITIHVTASTATETKYDIQVKAGSVSSQESTTIVNSIVGKKAGGSGSPFDYSVFFNEDLEIAPGPNMTVQGPIFSNKNVYLMTDDGSVLTFRKSLDFFNSSNAQPFVLHAAGNIYFGFKRGIGRNYMLDYPQYKLAVPSYYLTDNAAVYPGGEGHELDLRTDLGPSAQFRHPPFFYYYTNRFNFRPEENGLRAENILFEDANGTPGVMQSFSSLAVPEVHHLTKKSFFRFHIPTTNCRACKANWNYPSVFSYSGIDTAGGIMNAYYTTTYSDQPANSFVNISSAYDPTVWPTAATLPVRNPNWTGTFYSVVQDDVAEQAITLGAPQNSLGDRALIDPLTGTISNPLVAPGSVGTAATEWDTPELAAAKFQSRANISCCIPTNIPNYDSLTGILEYVMSANIFTVDVFKIVRDHPNARIVYLNLNNDINLINGARLPENGLTFVSNGRIWISGNFNTFSYKKLTLSGAPCRNLTIDQNDDANCHVSTAEWDYETCLNGSCKVPPAAIVSDSFGVATEMVGSAHYVLKERPVIILGATSNIIVNAAVITGSSPSYLERNFDCLQYNGSFAHCLVPNEMDDFWNFPLYGWKSDEYYVDSSGGFDVYYLKPQTSLYQNALNLIAQRSGAPYCNPSETNVNNPSHCSWIVRLPYCNPSDTNPQSAQNCNNLKIPLFADANDPNFDTKAPPLFGVYFSYLNKNILKRMGDPSIDEPLKYAPCVHTCSVQPTPRFNTPSCINEQPGVGEYTRLDFNLCAHTDIIGWTCPGSSTIYPRDEQPCMPGEQEKYWKRALYNKLGFQAGLDPIGNSVAEGDTAERRVYYHDALNLYTPRYGGGLENVIHLLEDWDGSPRRTLRFSGVLAALWESKNTINSARRFSPYRYKAPFRKFDYNESLKTNPPPGFGNEFTIKRERWKEVESG